MRGVPWGGWRAAGLAALLAGGCCAALAQPAPAFEPFLKRFRAAVAANDALAVADLTALPFLFDSVPRERAGFVRIYPQLFTAKVRQCLQRAAPVAEDGQQVMFCAPYGFYFGVRGGAWKLVEFGADGG